MKVRVFVPGTSANLGAGFDVYGIAVNLHNEFIVESSDTFEIKISTGYNTILTSKENLFYKSFAYLFNKAGVRVPTVKITMDLTIPQARGLGSSATAVVGGLIAANVFLQNTYSKDDLLPFALELEMGNNPDNVSPALYGGLVILTIDNTKLFTVKIPFPTDIKAVYFIPEFEMDTKAGRKLMPAKYSKEDLVFSTSRVALFLAALQTKKYNHFRIAMQDRIHQPARTKIFPLMPDIIKAANEAGCLGAALSGGGSSIIAFANKNYKQIEKAMKETAKKNSINGITKTLDITNEGVYYKIENK